ncbi:MAG: DEAD/DEAH box helicase [bacterium]|nr:DEAD/DEAH box helicase [bacterium]
MALHPFTDPTREWFESSFSEPTAAQVKGWKAISAGKHTLIHAPTGSGKTLAAFLWAIDRLSAEPAPPEKQRCRVLYVSPMKALAYDVERNLRAPLTGVQLAAQRLGVDQPPLSTAMRTGDTPQSERQSMLRHPPDILITTPESLYLMLTSQARQMLRTVRWVIIDEIHSVAATKRGSHLALSLERLTELAEVEPQRIGLSATQRPLEAIAEFLGGGTLAGDKWQPRPVAVVDAPWEKELDVRIVVPVADMTRPEETPVPPVNGVTPDPGEPAKRSIWPAMYPELLQLVRDHTSTLIFVNSRGLAERLAAELNRLAGEELVQSHHGSVSREQRIEIEGRLKRGELKAVVATSTLELGIDMAAIDLVLLVESPNSVARGLQRVGRAGHQVGAASVARVFPKHRGDLLETAVVVDRMYAGAIESTKIPSNPLDVLAQQVVAMTAVEPHSVDDIFGLIRRAGPYRDLTRGSLEAVLDMLAGRYPSDEFAELRPRIVWDRIEGVIDARSNARMLAVTNPGTIPDRGLYTVVLPEGGRVGELDEEMVYESRPGDTFVLGSSSWKISEINHDRVVVLPAEPGTAAKMPFWHGDGPGRPLELGRAVGAFVRRIGGLDREAAVSTLEERYRLEPWAACNLASFISEEKELTGALPTDRSIVVEQFRDEIGDWRVVVLSPFGSRVHAPWALAARRRYREANGGEVDVIWSDDGLMFRFPDVDTPPDAAALIIDPDELEELVLDEVGDSALFTARFREAASRSLLLPRRRPGSRTPLWLQRRRAADLLSVAKRYASFPVVLETYREILQDHFDLPAVTEVLRDIASRKTRVHQMELDSPSPMASSLMFDFIASFMYEYDAPIAEKRVAALTLDRSLLRELLGDPEFRDLLDSDVLESVELDLQRLSPERQITSMDQLHDMLNHLGPLSRQDIGSRNSQPDETTHWIDELIAQRRIVEVRVAGREVLAAVEDVSRLRDALGVTPPPGVAESLLESVADPLGDVVSRYARTHSPFVATEAAGAVGLPVAAVSEVLGRLEQANRVSSGAYRPQGHGEHEWVDVEVLRRLRRRSLAKLRKDVEAVEEATLGRFLPAWHGIGNTTSNPSRLLDVVRSLQGAALPASELETSILPARLSYQPAMLDDLLASGDLVWVGRQPLGAKDGRITFYLREQAPLLHWGIGNDSPDGPIHDRLRNHLAEQGASFFRDLYVAADGGDPNEVVTALWDLVWAGEITNDTLAPLRAFLWGRRTSRSRGRPQLSTATPPAASGRWSLVDGLLGHGEMIADESRGAALAEQMMTRHGIVTRDAVLSEGIPGGFSGLYPVFTALEDAGKARRGYFIEGRGGAQFALPGAVDRLRAIDNTGIVVMSAVDPANPYGALLPWPESPVGTPARRAGAAVALADGELVAYLEKGGRKALTFGDAKEKASAALMELISRQARPRALETINGEAAAGTAIGTELVGAGLRPGYKGLTMPGRT